MSAIKDRRAAEREELRGKILDAARELFIKNGYANVTMRQIASKIEYSPTTIYLYFEDKADLLIALCEEAFAELVKEFEGHEFDPKRPKACLKSDLRAYIDFGLRHPNHYAMMFMAYAKPKEVEERVDFKNTNGAKAYAHLREVVDRCIKAKALRKGSPDLTAQVLWAQVHGITSLLIAHKKFPWAPKDVLIDQIIENAVAGAG